ncbi:MAG: NUDIX domain-containing protein [Clostridia bacterium]|jgi:mutator protein MutT|nr:NUDIX domain-containing protein [Clostridia bacterium]MBQ5602496.1 NUDIX domain-containing protein [Clostridia bacterium]
MKEFWDIYDANGNIISDRVTERGKHDLAPHEYHLVVFAWIINDKNEFIISRRQKGRTFAGKWECTGGCAISGDTSISAALREVKEELGLTLSAEDGELFTRYRREYPSWARAICDVWVFRKNFEMSDFSLQKEEVSDVKFVSAQELLKIFGSGSYKKRYEYLPELVKKYTKVQ